MTLAGTASCDDRRSQRLYLPSANLFLMEERIKLRCLNPCPLQKIVVELRNKRTDKFA